MSNSAALHDQLRRMRSRAAIKKWEMRQIEHAGGVWFHLQLLLARSRRAFRISADEVKVLSDAGFEIHPLGAKLEPPKSIFVIREEMVPRAVIGTEVPLQDAQQLLLAPALILIPFR